MDSSTPLPAAAQLWRVLIIDDSPDDCAEVRRLLLKGSERRYSFLTAATGDAGVRAVRDADRGPPDCVILDYNLPDRDAVGILEAIRGPYGLPVCPVVVLTGRAESEIGRRVLRAGAQDFLGKENITPGSLTRAIENASERYTMARELRASEAALHASDERLRVATRVAGLAVAEIDYDTHLIHLSREAAVLFGMPAVEVAVSRASIHALFHPDDRPQLERMIAASHDPSGHGEFSLEFRVILADGTVRWHNVRKQVFFANGRPARALMALFDITDRKEFEEQLKRNHESFVKLVENNPFGLYVVDSNFRMLQLSLGARKVFSGISPLIGRDFSEVLRIVWPEQFAEAVTARFRHTLETGEPYFAPSTVQRRANVGETEAYEWRIERVGLPDGSNGVVCYFYDLTERQQWEAALLAKEQELRSLADNSPDILTRLDRNFRHVFVNATIKQATGRVAAEFLGKTHRELGIPAPLCAQWEADLRKVFASGYQRSFEFISDTPNGSRHYATQLVPEFDSDGAVEFVLAVSHDVTDSKRAEVAVRESEERLARAQRAAKVGTWEWDLDTGHSSWTLEAWELFTGSAPLDVAVKFEFWLACVHPDDRDRVATCIVSADAGAYRDEFRVRYNDGREAWLESAGETIREQHGRAFRMLGTVRNITDRKTAEKELRDADRRKDEFLATLAHELRNPLAPIRTGLTTLRMTHSPDQAGTLIDMMHRQVEYLVNLVDDLLDVSRVRTGKITLRVERSSVREVVQLAIETCATIIEEHAQTLTVELPQEELVLVGDRTRLVQVFANLLSNAAKYSTPGGHIRVTARRDAGEILVQVSDSGVGISADLLPTVWDLFTQVRNTVDKAQGGLGIGLSLVKKLVNLHGGSVTAESAGVGQGSTFSVRLPVAPVEEGRALLVPPVEGNAAATVPPAGRRVLVVDDNVDAADSQTILLGIAGYTTATAYSGRDAVRSARAFRPDVILLDIGLPDVDGYEVARQLRADPLTADMVLVALTGWGSDDHKRMSKEAGFDWHLTKPVEAKALTAALSLRHVARL